MTTAGAQAVDVLLSMDSDALSRLRADFRAHEKAHRGGIPLASFIGVMTNHLPPCSKVERDRLLLDMVELFELIDVNGDGTLDWEEFTSFCVEAGMVATRRLAAPLQFQFGQRQDWRDRESGASAISVLRFFPQLNRLVVGEEESTVLRVYNHRMELQSRICPAEALKPKLDPVAAARERQQPSALQVAGVVLCVTLITARRPQLVVACSDFSVTFWDLETGKLKRSEYTEALQTRMLYLPTLRCLLSCGVEAVINVWPLEGEWFCQRRLDAHTDVVTDLCYVPTHEVVATCSLDHRIVLWDAHTLRQRGTLTGHIRGITTLVYSTTNRLLISAGFEFEAIAWDISSRHALMRLSGHRCSLQSVALVQLNTEMAVTLDVQGVFKVWDIGRMYGTAAVCLQTFTAASGLSPFFPRKLCSLSPHRTLVAATGKMRLFEARKLQLADALPVGVAYSRAMAAFFVVSGRMVQTWCARTGRLIEEYHNVVDGEITSVCLDGRERRLVVGLNTGRVVVLNAFNMLPMKDGAPHRADVVGVAYTPDHSCVISASWDHSLRVYDDRRSNELILCRSMEHAHRRDITRLAFSPRLSLLATASADFSVRVWDFEMMRLEVVLLGHTVEVAAVCFMDPLPLLISADCAGTVLFWAMRPHSKAGKCVHAMRNLSPAIIDFLRASGKTPGAGPGAGAAAGPAGLRRMDPNDAERRMARARQRRGNRRRREAGQGDMAPVAVSALANYFNRVSKTHLLVTGDERGDVKTWEIGPVCRRLGLLPVNDGRLPSKRTGYNAHRRIIRSGPTHGALVATLVAAGLTSEGSPTAADAAEPAGAAADDDGQIRPSANPPVRPEDHIPAGAWTKDVRQVSMWRAHTDSLKDMYVLGKERCLVTTSYDKSVRIWGVTGDKIGVLSVSEAERVALSEGVAAPDRQQWLFRYDNAEAQRHRDAQVREVMRDIAEQRKKAIVEQGREGARRQAREALQLKQSAAKRLAEVAALKAEQVKQEQGSPGAARRRRPHSSTIFRQNQARHRNALQRPGSAAPGASLAAIEAAAASAVTPRDESNGDDDDDDDDDDGEKLFVHVEDQSSLFSEQGELRQSALKQVRAIVASRQRRASDAGSAESDPAAAADSSIFSKDSFGDLPDPANLRVLRRAPPPVKYGHLTTELDKKMANRAEGAIMGRQMDLKMSDFLQDNLADPATPGGERVELVLDPACMSPEDRALIARRLAAEQEATQRRHARAMARRRQKRPQTAQARAASASAAVADDVMQRKTKGRPASALARPQLQVDVESGGDAFAASFSGARPTTPLSTTSMGPRSLTMGQLPPGGLRRVAGAAASQASGSSPRRTSTATSHQSGSNLSAVAAVRKERRALQNRTRINAIISDCTNLSRPRGRGHQQKQPEGSPPSGSQQLVPPSMIDGFVSSESEGEGDGDGEPEPSREDRLAAMRARCAELQARVDEAAEAGVSSAPADKRAAARERQRRAQQLRKKKEQQYRKTKARNKSAAAAAKKSPAKKKRVRLKRKKVDPASQTKFGSYTAAEVMDVYRLFDEMDTDNSGTVSLAELRASTLFAGSGIESALLSTLRACAADNQEMTLVELFELTFPLASRKDIERMNLMVEMTRPKAEDDEGLRALRLDEVEELRRIFRQFDTEYTGYITVDQVFDKLNENGESFLTRQEVADVFERVESESNERLSLGEFQKMLHELYAREESED